VTAVWLEYDKWNAAMAEAILAPENAGLPVYIDVNTTVLSRVAQELGVDSQSAGKALAGVVRDTLGLGKDEVALQEHTERYVRWRRRLSRASSARRKGEATELPPPPVIALLGVLVMAAERMGADTSLAPHAYYPRLGEVLELSAVESKKLRNRFPQTELYWRGLNEYLEAHDGQRGLPTAYALSFRYVGVPQSQALVRATDREKLPDFFGRFGLSPGSEIIAADLERLLDAWITATPCPVSNNMRQLWNRGKARERVAGVVAVELALWDGTFRAGSQSASRSQGEVQLTALMRQQFGGRSLELSFTARLPQPVETDELVINSAVGEPKIGVVSAAGARLRPIPGSRLDAESLVGAILEFEEPLTKQTVRRRPRRVVPLRRDELLGILVESDRVQLADDLVLLVKDEERLVGKVLDVLATCGHHGRVYRSVARGQDSALKGVPEGWVLVDDVQILAIPQEVKLLDLQVLVPLTTAQLNFSGGLKLPGRIRKWSRLHPPEIRAVVSEADKMSVALYELDANEPLLLEKWEESASAMIVPLSDLELEDGDYEVELSVNGEIVSRQMLRLRSADTPDAVTWETCTRLNYELDHGAFATLSAIEADSECEVLVDGLNTLGEANYHLPVVPVRPGVNWSTTKAGSTSERPVVVLGRADPKSCVITGAHRIQLPTWHGGKSTEKVIVGVCEECGLRKTLPARPKWKNVGTPAATKPAVPLFSALPSHGELGVDLDSCLDALVHVGGGTIGAFERVSSQAEGGALFLDSFLRKLETIGHIDVRRDASLQALEWEANPACLAETISNGFVLAGVWSESARNALSGHLELSGGELVQQTENKDLSAWFARGVSAEHLQGIVDDLELSASVVPEAARRMLGVLPPLSEVEESLPLTPLPSYTKATVFDLDAATWRATPGVGVPGAYRVEQSFRTISLHLDAEGALSRKARVGSVQLVKHIAARHMGRTLLGYLDSRAMLLTPMGAELPGLYGRVASLCSGLPTVTSSNTRTVAYRDVPRDVADRLNTLLAN